MGLFSGLRRLLTRTPAPVPLSHDATAALADYASGYASSYGLEKAVAGPGERQLVTLFPGYVTSSFYASWSANRGELVQHYKGWNYVAIKAICEEIAGLDPQVAEVVTAKEVATLKAGVKSIRDPWKRRKAWGELQGRFLSRYGHHGPGPRLKALASVQQDDELEPVSNDDPLVRVLRNPNGPDTAWTFFYRLFMYLELTGSAYIWVVKDRKGDLAELWVLPSQWVRPRSGSKKLIDAYDIRPMAGYVTSDWGGGWFPGGTGNFQIDADEIIWIHYPHPVAAYFDGYAPISAMSEWIDISENIDRSRVAHFVNGMFPGVAVEIDKNTEDPKESTVRRLQADIAEKYQGVRQTKKPVVLAPGMKLVPFTQNAQEMDYQGGADQMKSFQLAGHRVGESMAGLAENTTFASMYAARANFYTSTIKPKLRMVGQALSEKLADHDERTGNNARRRVIYWEDATPVDPDFNLRKWTAGMEKGAATPNEFRREILDLPSFENGGDDPMVMMGMSPIPLNTGEDSETLPIPAVAAERFDEQGDQHGQGGGGMGGGGGSSSGMGMGDRMSGTGESKQGSESEEQPKETAGRDSKEADNRPGGYAAAREKLRGNLLKPGGKKSVRGWWDRSLNGHSNGAAHR